MSEEQAVFSIEKLYIKDLSVEAPNSPQAFLQPETPEVEVQLQTAANAVTEGLYEVVLTATVTARADGRTLFLVEAAQAGLFQIRGVAEGDLEPILAIACPNILFPYARETISDTVNRAGFPPVLLAPVNFDALYQQRAQAQAESRIEIAH
ncbi:MAG: protein-export chaperone SecB [Betaproteobacteria bacterium]